MKHLRHTFVCLQLILAGFTVRADTNSQLHVKEPKHIIIAPTNFIHQIASADRVVVSPLGAYLAQQYPTLYPSNYDSLHIELSGEKAQDVVKAISSLKNDRIVGEGYGPCGCEHLELQFYHGNKFLGNAYLGRGIVRIVDDDEYLFDGGILEDLYDEWDAMENKVWKNWGDEMYEKQLREEQTGSTNTRSVSSPHQFYHLSPAPQ